MRSRMKRLRTPDDFCGQAALYLTLNGPARGSPPHKKRR